MNYTSTTPYQYGAPVEPSALVRAPLGDTQAEALQSRAFVGRIGPRLVLFALPGANGRPYPTISTTPASGPG